MKKLTLLCTVLFTAFCLNAQNVAINNDASIAAPSAMLDVKSTTKGFMMPRVTSAQRTTIASPALGLLVFDTETKTIWAYDGNNWKNLYTSGGGLTLPFSQTVNTANSALQVTNQGAGAAIEGASTAQFGIGMTAKTTGEGGWGLYAFSNGVGSQSIRSFADNGTAFHGENNNAANTNTLMNLLNKGAGKTGSFQLANNSSSSPNVQIAGNHLGEQLKIYQTNASNSMAAVSIENSGTGAGINSIANNGTGVIGSSTSGFGVAGISNSNHGVIGSSTTGVGISGISFSNYGVKGVVNNSTMGTMAGVYGANNGTAGTGVYGVANFSNGAGVYGTSANGTGVAGFGDTYRAVQGLSNSGTALYGGSSSGYGLEVNGKVKIAGGNTNPGEGKVLTSDSEGNATWQQPSSTPNVAFRVKGVIEGFAELPVNIGVKLQFKTQEYDLSGNYISLTENGNLSEANVFYVPFNGIYHFSISVGFSMKNSSILSHYDYTDASAELVIIRSGVELPLNALFEVNDPGSDAQVNGSTDLMLQEGDRVFVRVSQKTYDALHAEVSMPLSFWDFDTFFSGHLVRKL